MPRFFPGDLAVAAIDGEKPPEMSSGPVETPIIDRGTAQALVAAKAMTRKAFVKMFGVEPD